MLGICIGSGSTVDETPIPRIAPIFGAMKRTAPADLRALRLTIGLLGLFNGTSSEATDFRKFVGGHLGSLNISYQPDLVQEDTKLR